MSTKFTNQASSVSLTQVMQAYCKLQGLVWYTMFLLSKMPVQASCSASGTLNFFPLGSFCFYLLVASGNCSWACIKGSVSWNWARTVLFLKKSLVSLHALKSGTVFNHSLRKIRKTTIVYSNFPMFPRSLLVQ